MKSAPRTQIERSNVTLGKLLTEAHSLFSTKGYDATSIESIVRAAGLTRGAFYHQYSSKLDVFRAVFEREEEALSRTILAATSFQVDVWGKLKIGCRTFLNACLEPSVKQIFLIDGPAKLGWETVREIESHSSLALLKRVLEDAVVAGQLRPINIDAFTHLLFGALCEGAMVIARNADPELSLIQFSSQIDFLLESLQTSSIPTKSLY